MNFARLHLWLSALTSAYQLESVCVFFLSPIMSAILRAASLCLGFVSAHPCQEVGGLISMKTHDRKPQVSDISTGNLSSCFSAAPQFPPLLLLLLLLLMPACFFSDRRSLILLPRCPTPNLPRRRALSINSSS